MSTSDEIFSLAVIICTKDRPQSLQRTLESLADADRTGIALYVIVLNNSPADDAMEAVYRLQEHLPMTFVKEKRPGKAFALNRGLSEGRDAEIVAIIDDDITVDAGWLAGVRAICSRWPDKGFFTGSSYIRWPTEDIPSWIKHPQLLGWAF